MSNAHVPPVFQAVLATMCPPPVKDYRNWVLLDAAGRRVGVVYASSADAAVGKRPNAATARPETAEEVAERSFLPDTYGRLD